MIKEKWRENFRMSKASLLKLAEELRLYIEGKETIMRSSVDVVKQVASTLYYLSDEGRLRKTANAFGVSRQREDARFQGGKEIVQHLFDELFGVSIGRKALGLVVVWNVGADTHTEGIVFISLFSIGLGGFKGIDRNVCSRSILWVTTIVECQSPKKAQIVAVDFSIIAVAIQGDQTMVLGQIGRQVSFRLKNTFAISGFYLPDSVNGGQKDFSANISQAYFAETFATINVCNHEFISGSVDETISLRPYCVWKRAQTGFHHPSLPATHPPRSQFKLWAEVYNGKESGKRYAIVMVGKSFLSPAYRSV
ncbi:unnamed protein product [Porites lobata]|uniref:Uncharacterized protein n=1 Tax=Porites lobata TaxID=104759 RepID=A0ABN8PZT7_9CNID|nr:unnamed protein product [Porites lobata]